jgi:hypothetical protein
MSVADQKAVTVTTEHGVLVAYGKFAQHLGVQDALQRIPFPMKTVAHSPAAELAELLVHILAGGMHGVELKRSAHPLVDDDTVAHAWGQQSFASASGISDLLRPADAAAVAALQAAVHDLLAPYRRRILREVSPGWLVVDLDLTALVVSDQAHTYQGADFGYMGERNGPARGYQFARAQLVGRQDVLLLGGFLHPGRTISRQCLRELVALIETELEQPRQRVDVVAARLVQAEQALAAVEQALAARTQGTGHQRRRCTRLEAQRERARAEVAALRARRDELAAANAANPHPRRIILRLDGGFGDADHLAWLYEEGYDFVARAHSHAVADGLRREGGLTWEKVSKNGFIAESQRTSVGACPYPMRLFACRQWRGAEKPER